jgi:hypothetical protein
MAMSAGLRFSRREHTSEGTDVIDLDTKAAASADHVTPVNVQRQFAQALPAASLRKNLLGARQQRTNLEPIQKLRQLKHYEGKRGGQVLNLRQLQPVDEGA